ncbi:MAG: DNA double-strand break repair nuclease NurA [Chloroflexota bacterium]|nr:DNA double-strand break repair nuclease NurA [Chloroflexota bacterium]
MTLHLEQIINDIDRMSVALNASERRIWLQEARRLLRTHDRMRLDAKLEMHRREKGTTLAPEPLGELDERVAAPPAPYGYRVVAVDGSNIPPERDSPARYYLLNLGLVTLCYGDTSFAEIDAWAQLYYQQADLYWDEKRQQPIDARRLSLLMRVEEIAALPDLAGQPAEPCVALVDGQLVMWGLQNETQDRWFLMERLLDAFERLREQRIPIVGYISDTESFELVNTLKIYLCPTTPDRCQQCHSKGQRELELCYHLNDFRDPALLFEFLEAGERSCCFASQAEILKRYPEPHKIVYFYMSTGDEIARVEMPRWVADDPELLDLVHGVLHDQCCRSGQLPPYPPILHEAHEAAVISTNDREWVKQLIAERLQREGLTTFRPAKAYHKRLRGV